MKNNRILIVLFITIFFFSNLSYSQNYFADASKEYFNGDLKLSIALFTISIKHHDEIAKSYMYRGAAKCFLQKFQESLADLDSSKILDSSYSKLYYYYGKYYLFTGNYNRAIESYDISISKGANDAFSYDERASAKVLLKDFKGALKDENIAISIDSTKHFFYADRGFARLKLKDYSYAMEDFNKSLKLAPNQKAYADRGTLYALLNDHQKAIDDFTKSLSIAPNDPEIYYYRGVSYKTLGKNTEACGDLKKSKELGYNKANEVLKGMRCN